MIAKLKPIRVRRTYLGGGRIDAFTGFATPATGHCQLRLSADDSTPFDPSKFRQFMFE